MLLGVYRKPATEIRYYPLPLSRDVVVTNWFRKIVEAYEGMETANNTALRAEANEQNV